MPLNKVTGALLGVATGDAVGVPYEFSSREKMKTCPATGMTGYGTYNQPEGTWSDDSSLTFCLAESLLKGYDLADIARKFIKWKYEAYWTARGEVFDIGVTTSAAISRLKNIIEVAATEELKTQKLHEDDSENGNGSLMRIIPLLFHIKGKSVNEQFDIVWEVSALTHRHIRAAMSCMIYLKLAEKLLEGKDKITAYTEMRKEITEFWNVMEFPDNERKHFNRVILNDIHDSNINSLKTTGYVIDVLESSIWFFLNKNNYEDTILSIINLGHDTDTSAAIAGGLAGIFYGQQGIPQKWLNSLARLDDIIDLGNRLNERYCS